VRPDILARGGKPGPDAGVRTGSEKAEGQRRERGEDCLDEGLTARAVLRGGTVHAVQQFGGRDGSDPDFLVRPQLLLQASAGLGHCSSRPQVPDGTFKVDEDGGV
jgi:hypothetical protein